MRAAAALALGLGLAAGLATGLRAKPLILIDPGHGGSDAGVQAPGFKESDYTLDLARRLQAALSARGVDSQLTRDHDMDLSPSARVALADAMQPTAMISLHANAAFQEAARGPRIFTPAPGPVDEPAAPLWPQASRLKAGASKALGLSLARALGQTGPRAVQNLRLAVFRGLNVPACLVETEFASNPEGLAELKDPAKRDALAVRLAAGLGAWIQNPGAVHAP